jgi:hypothetical protein
LELLLLLHFMQHKSKKYTLPPAPKKEKERESRNLYGIMEK